MIPQPVDHELIVEDPEDSDHEDMTTPTAEDIVLASLTSGALSNVWESWMIRRMLSRNFSAGAVAAISDWRWHRVQCSSRLTITWPSDQALLRLNMTSWTYLWWIRPWFTVISLPLSFSLYTPYRVSIKYIHFKSFVGLSNTCWRYQRSIFSTRMPLTMPSSPSVLVISVHHLQRRQHHAHVIQARRKQYTCVLADFRSEFGATVCLSTQNLGGLGHTPPGNFCFVTSKTTSDGFWDHFQWPIFIDFRLSVRFRNTANLSFYVTWKRTWNNSRS